MKSLTFCQDNIIKVGVRTVGRHLAGSGGMESLTSCQANRTKAEVRTVRKCPTWHEITCFLSNQ